MRSILTLLMCSTFYWVMHLHGENALQGYVIGWGNNVSGVATGTAEGKYSTGTVVIAGQIVSNAVAISAGRSHALALLSNGRVIGWGSNMGGRATGSEADAASGVVKVSGHILSDVTAVSAHQFSVALRHDGTVVAWGTSGSGHEIDVPTNLTNALAIASGEDHCLVLKKDGILVRVGTGGSAELGVSNVVAMAGGRLGGFRGRPGSDLALKSDGKVVCLDTNPFEENGIPKELTNILTLASSGAVKLALTKDGRVFGWGTNDRGQAIGVRTTNYTAHGFVMIGGHVLNEVTAIAAGRDTNLALKRDGTVVGWGREGIASEATIPEGLSNVVAIAAGPDYCLAITTNKAVAERFMQKEK
jgi:alpha-tubulin suppressor-like RCC1 family protein